MAAALIVLIAAAWGFSSLRGASTEIDPARLATAERGAMVRSVVATGKVEPVTKVEIKSKANGIIKLLPVEVDQEVEAGTVLVQLDTSVEQAELRALDAQARLAQTMLTRREELLKHGATTQDEVDQVRGQHELADALKYDEAPHPSTASTTTAPPYAARFPDLVMPTQYETVEAL